MKWIGKLVAGMARRLITPFVPAGKALLYNCWLHKLDGAAEPELLHLDDFIAATGTAIDVGVDRGFYTCALSRRFKRVYAFEINEGLAAPIAQFNPGNIEIVNCRLWPEADTDETTPSAGRPVQNPVPVARLDSFSLDTVDLIRIGAGEAALEVLAGAAATIEKSRPMVLVSLKKEQVEAANDWFRNLDYKHCFLEDFNEVRGSAWNHIYTPFERLASFGIARPLD